MKPRGRITLLLLIVLTHQAFAQGSPSGTGPREKRFSEELKSNRQMRREAREKRKLEKQEQKAIRKHHKRIQTKAVQKRMKASKRKSKRYNDNTPEFFLKRWYHKIRH